MKTTKRILAMALLAVLLLGSSSVLANGYVTMYAPDGRAEIVDSQSVGQWESVGWYTYPVQKVYAADGREAIIARSEVPAWENVGWFAYPVTTMYSLDGRTMLIAKSDVPAWNAVGWYDFVPAPVYAPDGRVSVIPVWDVPAWESVGWYTYPVWTVYAADGRSAVIAQSDVEAWKSVGWYDNPWDAEMEQAYNITVNEIYGFMAAKDYSSALGLVQEMISELFYATKYEIKLDALRTEIMAAWRSYCGAPLAILDSYASEEYSVPEANILYCNISHKTIAGFKLEFTCYNIFGEVEETYYDYYYDDAAYLGSGEYEWGSWDLYGADSVNTIKNIYVTEIVYTDGTKWYR